MDIVGLGKRVQMFIDEGDRWEGHPLFLEILRRLHDEGAAGATVSRGVAGFGAHSRIHMANFPDVLTPLPLVITWIDAPARVERLLPLVCSMVTEGLVTVEDIEIARYSHRDLGAPHPSVRVDEIMTRDPVTVSPDAPLGAIVDLLVDRDFRALPVVDADKRLLGIVTNTDLVERGGLPARVELLAAVGPAERAAVLREARPVVSAADLMTPDPVTISPDAALDQTIARMHSHQLKRLPVVDPSGRLLGIISRADILRALGESYPLPGDAPSNASGPRVVGDIMTRHAPVVRKDAGLAEVLDSVISTRLNRTIVVDAAGRPVGVISDTHVLQHLDPPRRLGFLQALMGRARAVPSGVAHLTARDIMRGPPLAATPEEPIATAARRMVEERRKVLSVVNSDGVLQGIVDRAHMLAAARNAGRA